MSLEETKAIVHKLIEAINKRNPDMLDELMAPDYVDYPLQLRGLAGAKQSYNVFFKGFPDFYIMFRKKTTPMIIIRMLSFAFRPVFYPPLLNSD